MAIPGSAEENTGEKCFQVQRVLEGETKIMDHKRKVYVILHYNKELLLGTFKRMKTQAPDWGFQYVHQQRIHVHCIYTTPIAIMKKKRSK